MAPIEVEDRERVRTITLNRPERRNALTPELIDELTVALRGVRDADARAVVLRGAGEAFCAGLDITELQRSASKSAEEHRIDAERIARLFKALWECDAPTVALVQGPAIAGGTGLATITDFTLATPEAKFGYTEVRIGFVPALVSAYLALQVGDKTARSLLMTARIFGAEEALRLGLITEIVERQQMEERGHALVADLLRNSSQGIRATRHLLRAQHAAWLDQAIALAMEANAASRTTDDFREGVAAFLEKRSPVWR